MSEVRRSIKFMNFYFCSSKMDSALHIQSEGSFLHRFMRLRKRHGLKCGIVGLPNVGKSTLFKALTSQQAEAANFPFCTIEPNVGIVPLRDERLDFLAQSSRSLQTIPSMVHFVDIAGLIEGAHKGEGLGNAFLSHIREMDALLHVVRCFDDDEIIHVCGGADPERDVKIIQNELVCADWTMAESALGKLKKQRLNKEVAPLTECMERVVAHLASGAPFSSCILSEEEQLLLTPYSFLTDIPTMYVANVKEDEPVERNAHYAELQASASQQETRVLSICAQFEGELADLTPQEKEEFSGGESGLQRIVHSAFDLLECCVFFTAGEKEARSWTIRKGMSAPEAAGAIHSDFEKKFIRAEVIAYGDYHRAGGRLAAKEQGKMRMEGKEYVVQDGDIIIFHTN